MPVGRARGRSCGRTLPGRREAPRGNAHLRLNKVLPRPTRHKSLRGGPLPHSAPAGPPERAGLADAAAVTSRVLPFCGRFRPGLQVRVPGALPAPHELGPNPRGAPKRGHSAVSRGVLRSVQAANPVLLLPLRRRGPASRLPSPRSPVSPGGWNRALAGDERLLRGFPGVTPG